MEVFKLKDFNFYPALERAFFRRLRVLGEAHLYEKSYYTYEYYKYCCLPYMQSGQPCGNLHMHFAEDSKKAVFDHFVLSRSSNFMKASRKIIEPMVKSIVVPYLQNRDNFGEIVINPKPIRLFYTDLKDGFRYFKNECVENRNYELAYYAEVLERVLSYGVSQRKIVPIHKYFDKFNKVIAKDFVRQIVLEVISPKMPDQIDQFAQNAFIASGVN